MGRKFNRKIILLLVLGLVFFFKGAEVYGAGFPQKPVRIIVNFPAGSAIDLEARGIAPYLEKHLGVRIIIENLPGADGKIGLIKAWKAKPDGYTLVMHTASMSILVEKLTNPEYRIIDFSHISPLSRTNSVLVVNAEKWKTFDEFLLAARKGTLSAGLPGIGSTSQLNGLILTDGLGIKVNWVPFGGSPEALTSLAGKHIDLCISGSNVVLPLVKSGRLRPLLALTDNKDMIFPNIPLAKEVGYDFNFVSTIRGVDGPPRIPAEVINVIEKAFAKAVKEPNFLAWTRDRMLEVFTLNPKAYTKLIESQQKEAEKYKEAFKVGK